DGALMDSSHSRSLGWPGTSPLVIGTAHLGWPWPEEGVPASPVSRETNGGRLADEARETTSAAQATPGASGPVSRETARAETVATPATPAAQAPRRRKIGVQDLGHAWTGTRIITVSNQKGGVGK